MKTKVLFMLVTALMLAVSIKTKAQATPFYTISIENGNKDNATGRLIICEIRFLPEFESNYTLDKNIRNWAKEFFNTNTGIKLANEELNSYRFVESFYEKEFQKKLTPKNEKMGMNTSLEFSNSNLVTYNAFYGHALNDVVCKMDIATFDRNDGHRLTLKDIFKCDENTIKKLMLENKPEGFPCEISSANDIKIVNVGINRKTIDVAGSVFQGSTAVYQIPFEDAAEYLTEKAYKMHGMVVTRMGTAFSDEGMNSYAVKYFKHLLANSFVSLGKYHNTFNDRDYSSQLDVKYDFDKDGKIKIKNSKARLYFEVPSDDDNKEAYLEFSKSEAKSFVDDLQKYLKDYNSWKKKMASQKFAKYKPTTSGDGKCNISFYRVDNNSYGYDENREYICQFVYDKYLNKTAIILKVGKKEGTFKKLLNLTPLASNSDKNLNMEIREDKLSGWTLVIENPDKEIAEICKAIQICIDKMK